MGRARARELTGDRDGSIADCRRVLSVLPERAPLRGAVLEMLGRLHRGQ
jgi:hypothetical protein